MADPRDIGLPWPFVAVDEDPFVGVEIAPNEIVLVALAGTFRDLVHKFSVLDGEYKELRQAAEEQVKATNDLLDVWGHYGHRHD